MVKIGIIGAGAWGANLVKSSHRLGYLAGVADRSEDLRASLKISLGEDIPLFESHAELLATDVAAVMIATPAPTHFQIAREALFAGKDVFVEKPMTLDPEEAHELIKIAEEHDRILMVGHLLLFHPPIQKIRQIVAEEKFGSLRSIHQRRAKLGRARSVENALWSLGVHDVAVILYLLGETPDFVSTTGHCGLNADVEDDVTLHLGFEDGTMANLHVSWLWPKNERHLTLIFERAMLVHDEISGQLVLYRKSIDGELQNVDDGEEILSEESMKPLDAEIEHFVHCVSTRTEPLSSGRRSLGVVEVLSEAEKQLSARRKLDVPLGS